MSAEQPMGKIIRWTHDPEWGWFPPGTTAPYMPDGPQVDDLLAWLHEHAPGPWDYGGRPGSYWTTIEWPSTARYPYEAVLRASLLEALSAAVRVVAASEEPQP